ncbi:MAG: FecR family protein [Cyclobacteriaceae bacterium]
MKDFYTLEELLEDPSFLQYAQAREVPQSGPWHRWRLQHPEQEETIRQALKLLRGVNFNKRNLAPQEIEWAWSQVERKIEQPSLTIKRRPWYYAAAATVSLLLLATLVWWANAEFWQETRLQADYGETKTFKLPDGTEVVLNANSSISFHEEEMLSQERKVYLEGEAYFKVVKTKNNASFFVISSQGGVIEVLGTEFNVFSRDKTTRVVLEEGKVHFSAGKKLSERLEPGDMVEYSGRSGKVQKKKVNARRYTSWRQNRLYFDETSIVELQDILTHTYGVKVEILDKGVMNKKLSGEIASDNLPSLLKAISLLFNIQVIQEQNTIYLKSMKP